MRIMVIGSGGREHAIIRKLKESPKVEEIYALPGNGGMEEDALCVNIGATDFQSIEAFAVNHGVDFAVVAPDDPLVLGCVDCLNARGIPCFGPTKDAAIIEGSKSFAKDLMKKYGIPTAAYEKFDNCEEALKFIERVRYPLVIKADGLALGKGVVIVQRKDTAARVIREMMEGKKFGASGEKIVVEEFLTGPEVSVLAFTDGETVVPMVSSMDHKRAGDKDTGLNTGGMGTIAPNPFYTEEIAAECMETIFIPTIEAMKKEGRPFKGCLYFGLMLTKAGPKVIEYNCRFGDPETQVVLPLLESDLLEIMLAVSKGQLKNVPVRFKDQSACCVIMASAGYPKSYDKGFEITIPEELVSSVYVAGARKRNGTLVTSGGRVLGVTAVENTLKEAVEKAYEKVEAIHFDNAYSRTDIGMKALKALGEEQQ